MAFCREIKIIWRYSIPSCKRITQRTEEKLKSYKQAKERVGLFPFSVHSNCHDRFFLGFSTTGSGDCDSESDLFSRLAFEARGVFFLFGGGDSEADCFPLLALGLRGVLFGSKTGNKMNSQSLRTELFATCYECLSPLLLLGLLQEVLDHQMPLKSDVPNQFLLNPWMLKTATQQQLQEKEKQTVWHQGLDVWTPDSEIFRALIRGARGWCRSFRRWNFWMYRFPVGNFKMREMCGNTVIQQFKKLH